MERLTKILQHEENNCIFFIGAGVSKATSGDPLSLWPGLLRNGIERCHCLFPDQVTAKSKTLYEGLIDTGLLVNLLTVAQFITSSFGGNNSGHFGDWMETTIGALPKQNTDLIDAILAFDLPIVTTNYDKLIERVSGFETYNWSDKQEAIEILQGNKKNAVLHLHGNWDQPNSIIFDWQTYNSIVKNEVIQALLNAVISFKHIIFVGFGAGMNDPNFTGFINWAKLNGVINTKNQHFALVTDDILTLNNTKNYLPENVIPISYGTHHTDLIPFLKKLFSTVSISSPLSPPTPPPDDYFDKYVLYSYRSIMNTGQINKHFVGRESETEEILDAVEYMLDEFLQPDSLHQFSRPRLFWVSGFGGMGKSWLLRKVYIDLASKHNELKTGLIEWDSSELSEPYKKPISVEQMLEVIAQRIGQLYRKESIRKFINALAEVRKFHDENNKLESIFKEARDEYIQKLSNSDNHEKIKGDHIPTEAEREKEQNISILDGIFNERNSHATKNSTINLLNRSKTEHEVFDELFTSWALQKCGNATLPVINPDQYLMMALKDCINEAILQRPLILMLDTCEVLSDKQDKYLRLLIKSLLTPKNPFIALIGNRNVPDIFQRGKYSKYGWKQEIDSRLMKNIYIDREPLSIANIEEMISKLERPYPEDIELATKLFYFSKGIPFTLKNIFELHEKGDNILWELDAIYGEAGSNLDESKAKMDILEATCDRILLHLETYNEDLEDIVLLAMLQNADQDILRCYWNEFPRTRLEKLMQRHSFITDGNLHENVRSSFRKNWRNRPIEMVEIVRKKLESMLVELKPVSITEDVIAYFNWLTMWVNIVSWATPKVYNDMFRCYFLGSLINQNVKPILELCEEMPGSKTEIAKAKEVFDKLYDTYSFFDTVEEPVLEYLENLRYAEWDRYERGCLFLFLADGYSKTRLFQKSIHWFDQAFEVLEGQIPQETRMKKSYLDAVFNFTLKKSSQQTIQGYLKWSKKFDFTSPHLNIELGKVLHNVGNYNESNKMFERGLEEDPNNIEVVIYLAHNLAGHQEEYEAAISVIEKHEDKLKYDARMYLAKGRAYEGLKEFDKAEQTYLTGYDLAWFSHDILAEDLVELYLYKIVDEQKAMKWFEELKSKTAEKFRIVKCKAKIAAFYGSNGKVEEANKYWDEIEMAGIDKNFDSSNCNSIAWALYSYGAGKLKLAEKYAKCGYGLEPDNLNVLHTLIAILIRQDKWRESVQYLKSWVEKVNGENLDSNDFRLMFIDIIKFGHEADTVEIIGNKRHDQNWEFVTWALLKMINRESEIQLSNTNLSTAVNFYKKVVLGAGNQFWYEGQVAKALHFYSLYKNEENNPEPDWYSSYGQILVEAELYQDAEPVLVYAVKNIKNEVIRAYALSGRGLMNGKQRLFAEALKDFDESLTVCPNNAWAYFNRAQVYMEMNSKKKALQDYQTALLKTGPGLPLFKRAYAQDQIKMLTD